MTDTIIAKIQVRRGELDDLPILDEGEFGYAMDYNRLFIGNSPVTFTADGVTTRFSLYTRSILPGQLKVLVDDVEQMPGQEYNIQNTDIVFAEAPTVNQIIKVSYNTELAVVNNRIQLDNIFLSDNAYNYDTGISWNLANFNSASIDYSFRNTNNEMNIGTIKIITDGNVVSVVDSGGGIGNSQISFDGRISDDNRLYVTYTNPTNYQANFFYTIQLWNTI